jgi:hypothetical protein
VGRSWKSFIFNSVCLFPSTPFDVVLLVRLLFNDQQSTSTVPRVFMRCFTYLLFHFVGVRCGIYLKDVHFKKKRGFEADLQIYRKVRVILNFFDFREQYFLNSNFPPGNTQHTITRPRLTPTTQPQSSQVKSSQVKSSQVKSTILNLYFFCPRSCIEISRTLPRRKRHDSLKTPICVKKNDAKQRRRSLRRSNRRCY